MKASKVLFILGITKSTLRRYRDNGVIRATKLSSGQYDYDDDSVYRLKNGGRARRNVIYARVSTYQQNRELKEQVNALSSYAEKQGYNISGIYQDVSSGISFKNRRELSRLLSFVLEGKVSKVLIVSPDRLSRTDFSLYRSIFKRYDTEIVCLNDKSDSYVDMEEFSHDMRDYLNSFSNSLFVNDTQLSKNGGK